MKKIFILALFFAFTVQLGFSQFFVGGGYDVSLRTSMGVSAEVGYRFPHRFFSVGMMGAYWVEHGQRFPIFSVGLFGEATLFTFGRRSSFVAGLSFTYHIFQPHPLRNQDPNSARIDDVPFDIGLPLTWEVFVGRHERIALRFEIGPTVAFYQGSPQGVGYKLTLPGLRVFF